MDVPTIPARSIVIKNKSTAWFGTRYTMNIYRGCSHGCIYCDSRSECYGVQDFDTVRVKSDALAVIRNDLRSKTQSGVVATGSMSDPYNPFEKELQLTRHALELLDAYGFGAAVATKGTLITRDADILLATKYIYNNFRKPLTLEDVSSVASLSPTYFSKKFKLITGMGFKEYLNYVRLKHAQTALLTTDSSITDIALEYGFNDSNYFKDLFKKVYGKSPREYRKNPD
mgnify:CR=1 FL=1